MPGSGMGPIPRRMRERRVREAPSVRTRAGWSSLEKWRVEGEDGSADARMTARPASRTMGAGQEEVLRVMKAG